MQNLMTSGLFKGRSSFLSMYRATSIGLAILYLSVLI